MSFGFWGASYVLSYPKLTVRLPPPGLMLPHSVVNKKSFGRAPRNPCKGKVMEEKRTNHRNKGGRPAKAIKRDQHLAVKCSLLERKIIERKAKMLLLTVSQFLRELGLKGHVDQRSKTLPREVVQLTANLNHMAANLNQMAYRRNRGEALHPAERTELNRLCDELKTLARQIKTYVQ